MEKSSSQGRDLRWVSWAWGAICYHLGPCVGKDMVLSVWGLLEWGIHHVALLSLTL
jgi:hypothetical protein